MSNRTQTRHVFITTLVLRLAAVVTLFLAASNSNSGDHWMAITCLGISIAMGGASMSPQRFLQEVKLSKLHQPGAETELNAAVLFEYLGMAIFLFGVLGNMIGQ